MSARRGAGRALLIAASWVLVAAVRIDAQVCLETPVPPAGWAVQARLIRAAATLEPTMQSGTLPAVTGGEASIARDMHGPLAASLAYAQSAYEILVFQPDSGNFEPADASSRHLSARFAYALSGSVAICPVFDAGWFAADVDSDSVDYSRSGFYFGAGATAELPQRLDERVDLIPFGTARLVLIRASASDDLYYGSSDGPETLPKLSFALGTSLVFRWVFVGVDYTIWFPGGDPGFWMRHASADENAATALGLRAGLVF